ncbi:MAG: hypothetical protein FJY76_00810 [Candidatus Aenigmarchaeota archaeon]|nr:hypothetical protein [Candidatus Aenigmarchaeota archaeon]
MAVCHKKKLGAYHVDTFDDECAPILVAEGDTVAEVSGVIERMYRGRIDEKHGADRVDIVDKNGDVLKTYHVR